jgi:hypothetical protein
MMNKGGHTMSINKPTEKTEAQDPITLSDDPQALLLEYHAIQAQLVKMNEEIQAKNVVIQKNQQEVEVIRQQGLQFIGQANILFRILKGKGIDANAALPSMPKPQTVEPPAPMAPAEVSETKQSLEDTSPAAQILRNRFPRR